MCVYVLLEALQWVVVVVGSKIERPFQKNNA